MPANDFEDGETDLKSEWHNATMTIKIKSSWP